MATDKEMIDYVLYIGDDLASMANVIDGGYTTHEKVNIERLRKLYPKLNEALAVLCGVVECFEVELTNGKTFSQLKFGNNKELLALVEEQKKV